MVALMAVHCGGCYHHRLARAGHGHIVQQSLSGRVGSSEWFASCVKDIGRKAQRHKPCYRKDTFLVVRVDDPTVPPGTPGRAAYYYLAQPAPAPSSNITYYPLFSASTDPSDLSVIQTPTINLGAPAAPAVPTPAPPSNSSPVIQVRRGTQPEPSDCRVSTVAATE